MMEIGWTKEEWAMWLEIRVAERTKAATRDGSPWYLPYRGPLQPVDVMGVDGVCGGVAVSMPVNGGGK